MEFISSLETSLIQWILVILASMLVGFAKTGINGSSMIVIPILAGVFGGKESTGIMLSMLIIGGLFSVWYYNRHANWGDIKRLLPWAFIGISFGAIAGRFINDTHFKIFIAISVLVCLGILVYTKRKNESLNVPDKSWFYILMGIAAGFTSMIGNAAGPIFSIYLLAADFKKKDFMGTAAWFFLITDLTKLPLQIFLWNNISVKTLIFAAIMIPAITIGAFLGIMVIKRINEKPFRYVIITMTAIAAIRLLF